MRTPSAGTQFLLLGRGDGLEGPGRYGGIQARRHASQGWVGIFVTDRDLPMVSLRLLVRSGSWEDPTGKEGLAYLTAQLLLEGTKRRAAAQIHEAVDSMGGALFVEGSGDYTLLGLTLLREDLEAGLELLAELLQEASFPEAELERWRSKLKGEIASHEDRPGGIAHRRFLEAVFGRGGYGHDPRGFTESLEKITIEDVREYYLDRLRGQEAVLVAVGDVEADPCIERLEGLLRDWREGAMPAGDVFWAEASPSRSRSSVVVHREIPQATVLMGQEGVPWGHPDRYVLQVVNYILGGGGFDSRLMEEIRSKRGLAYSAHSAVEPALHNGIFRVGFQTENESAAKAMEIALEVVEGVRKRAVTQEELEGAKRFLVGSLPMRLDSNAGLASSLALWECYGLGMDYPGRFAEAIRSVEAGEVLRAAREHLHPDGWVKVLVGDRGRMGL